VAQTDARLQALAPGLRLINFGHLGDGNLHYNVQPPAGADAAAFVAAHEAAIGDAVYQSVHHFGGSISAEHGIGALKRDHLPHYKAPVALQLMQTIKQALDPQCLLNPGRVLERRPGQMAR
jgi:FAD/FMN-containing dehydrogenase